MNNNLDLRNRFIESCNELGISMREDLTEKVITDSYNKILTQHTNAILNGDKTSFEIQIKKDARDYLLNCIKPKI